MGTRGAVVLVAGGNEKTVYNHFDSYPDGLGEQLLSWLRGVDPVAARLSVMELRAVDESAEPERDELDKLAANAKRAGLNGLEAFGDLRVSTGKDWYSYLRNTQGNLNLLLAAGYYADASSFPLDSLFCEWAYVIDFDENVFEVYKGFQEEPPTEGRWVGKKSERTTTIADQYYPVQRVAVFPFDALPDDLSECNPVEEEDED